MYGDNWPVVVQRTDRGGLSRKINPEDLHFLLNVMWDKWQPIFSKGLSHRDRNYISELRDVRNLWAHNERFSIDDTLRTLDTSKRLLKSVAAADQATQVDQLYQDLLRQLCKDLLGQQSDQQAQSIRHQAAAAPSQPTYSSKPTDPGVSREVDERPIGYTIFGLRRPWRSGIGMWVDVVEQIYFRHERDFLGRAERLRLTPGSRRVLISGNPRVINRPKKTKVPGIYIEYSLTQAECVKLAYLLLELFEHPPSDLYFDFNGDGAKPAEPSPGYSSPAAAAPSRPTYSTKPTKSGVSREVDKRPINYTIFGVLKPWRSGISMWADVLRKVHSRHKHDFLERAKKLELERSSRFHGKLISDNPQDISRPRDSGVNGIYIERSLTISQLIELAYMLLRMFGHTDSDLVIHWD